jgi:hypothetical protein
MRKGVVGSGLAGCAFQRAPLEDVLISHYDYDEAVDDRHGCCVGCGKNIKLPFSGNIG